MPSLWTSGRDASGPRSYEAENTERDRAGCGRGGRDAQPRADRIVDAFELRRRRTHRAGGKRERRRLLDEDGFSLSADIEVSDTSRFELIGIVAGRTGAV
jgi:hypothetical protein